jgi:hypothetical protein
MSKVRSLPVLLRLAQVAFNRWIRHRDRFKGCISCGSTVTEAGHYYSQGHHSALRFSEINTNGQCTRCNCFLHGNLIHYRNGLVSRYTKEEIDLLDSTGTRNPLRKWQRHELEFIIKHYQCQAPSS